jgi:pimeloyl-ACP methyl ester carboxylesterase
MAVLVALAALLALNALLVDGETEKATVTEPGGRILDLPEGELEVTEHGPRKGSPIVLIHCFSCAINWWNRVMPMLDRKHRVIAVDLLGHGGSEKPGGGYTIPHQADAIAEALGRLNVEGAEIVGHSLGGSVAVDLAERHPDLASRVVIIDTSAGYHSRGSLGFIAGLAFEPVIGEALWRIKPDFATRKGLEVAFAPGFDVPDEFVEDVNRMTYTAYDESPSGSEDYSDEEPLGDRMRATGLPLMVLMGEEEQIVDDPTAALAEYKRGVPGVETHLIAGAGHSPNVEKPGETAKLLLSFGEKSVASSPDRASGVSRGAAPGQ